MMKKTVFAVLMMFVLSVTAMANWISIKKILEGDESENISFGYSIDTDGDYIVVGAPDEGEGADDHDGAVYIFKKDRQGHITKLRYISGTHHESLGKSVAVKDLGNQGLFIVAGGPDWEFYNEKLGYYVYHDHISIYKLDPSTGDIDFVRTYYGDDGNGLGTSVDIAKFSEYSNNSSPYVVDYGILVVAGEHNVSNSNGQVNIYSYSIKQDEWKEQNISLSGELKNHFGYSVAISDDSDNYLLLDGRAKLVIGAPDENITSPTNFETYEEKGAAYIYKIGSNFSDDFNWTQQARVHQNVSSLLVTGTEYNEHSHFGTSVDISSDGHNLIVGALLTNIRSTLVHGPSVGAAYIYHYDSYDQDWDINTTLIQPKDPSNTVSERYGTSVAIDSTMSAVVGAPQFLDKNAQTTGAVFSYKYQDSQWKYLGSYLGETSGNTGQSVDIIHGNIVVSGNPENDFVNLLKDIRINPALIMYLLH
jgi:hypothetical protein